MLSFDDLEARWVQSPRSPRDAGRVALIVLRVGEGAHETPASAELTPDAGVVGDRWALSRAPDPGSQVTLMNARVAEILADGQPLHLSGDNFFVDLDLSEEALPVGSELRLGSARLRVTDKPHRPCGKFARRLGEEAFRWVNAEEHRTRRLRGVKCQVLSAGTVALGDWIAVERAAASCPPRAPEVRWPVTSRVGPGLDGAIAAATRISCVDGERGTLEYRGIPIEDLAGRATFEEVACLLIRDLRPSEDSVAWSALRNDLRAGRQLAEDVSGIVRSLPLDTHPTRLLRAGISAAGCFELLPGEDTAGARHWDALRVVGQVAALAGVIARHRRGLAPLPIEADASFARGLVASLSDREPDDELSAALDLCLVLYADNGMDAPTFTSMIVGSALADPYYNVVAGLSALRGPRVGGAGEIILRELLPLRNATDARAWIDRRLAEGRRIPGFGHRVFRVPDPRVPMVRDRAGLLAAKLGDHRLFDVVRAVEERATERLGERQIHANVNLYAAVVFHLLGAVPDLMPCLVAVGRMAGLVARVREYLAQNRLFRPLSRYVGPDRRAFVGLEDR